MRSMNDYLAQVPFDFYALSLFRLVAEQQSFTRAAERAGLTQSAVTRQIQSMEDKLGVPLLERTTRSVVPTPAGAWLLHEAQRLLGDVDGVLRRMKEEFGGAKKIVRVGVSRSIALAYLPGFFHANLRRAPEVACRLHYEAGDAIVRSLEANELDVGVICPPSRGPTTLRVTHTFDDAFTLIVPSTLASIFPKRARKDDLQRWADGQSWLLLDEKSQTGRRLREWMARHGCKVEPTLRLDSYDLIISLVSLGMGVSFVPIRSLALYGRKRTIRRLPWPERFVRKLVVVVRANREQPPHVEKFIHNVLF
jgi:DNA-binding transcriptional LysR family regulator